MTAPKTLPDSARIVIIGGGVGGASVAYHLTELGERDIVVLDRSELTSGSTFHSAGLVGQLRADPTLTRMNMYSVELYRKLRDSEFALGWNESGGIKLASSPERLDEIRRQISWAKYYDLPLVEISVAEAVDLFPLMNPDGVVGAAYLPSDGYLDPSQLCLALANMARTAGAQIFQHTRVLGIDVTDGRVHRVRTDRGDIDCEVVVNCGGIYAAEIGRLAGVRIPIVPMSHQYLITESFRERSEKPLPTLRDPDLLVYYRPDVDGLLMGGYERNPAPWQVSENALDAIPSDFNHKLLPEDWTRLEEIAENSQRRVPVMGEIGVRTFINGPEGFTPDNEFCLGETEVAGFFVAAGFNAHGIAGAGGIGKVMAEWVVDGEPSMDLWHMDINRFGRQYQSPSFTLKRTVENYQTYYDIAYPGLQRQAGRPLRISPAYSLHKVHGAEFGEKAGWERVEYYRPHTPRAADLVAPLGWAGRDWSPATGAEHRATRNAVAMFDETSFAKIEVTGPDAATFMNWVCDNDVARSIGDVTYTQALNARGGIEADFTVTRTGVDSFRVVTGTAFGTHDIAWLRKQARRRASNVRIVDITGSLVCYGVWGPRARDLLARLTSADLSNEAFPFMSSQEITVADVALRAVRVTFVGELGWELYASTEYGAGLWASIWAAGADLGLTPGGYRAIESLRLEKGYRVWSTDLTPETTPYEAGLGFCVKLDKPGGFEGRDALIAAKAAGLGRRLRGIVLDDPRRVPLGGEPVRVGDAVVSRVTSGGFGYTVNAAIAYAYLPIASAEPGTRVELDMFGEWVGGVVAKDGLYDPKSERVRA